MSRLGPGARHRQRSAPRLRKVAHLVRSARWSPYGASVPRKPRHQEAGAYYHVVSRGNDRQPIFDDELRQLFLADARCRTAFDWRVFALALMPNHFHLVVKFGTPGLSDGMCELNNRFARASNTRFGRINHCFGQRFWSSHLDDQTDHARTAVAMCLWNPASRGRVPGAWGYEWTSFARSVGLDPAQTRARRRRSAGVFRTERSRARRRLFRLRLRRSCPVPGTVATGRRRQVSVYSGPEPPSGGVRRPPFAVMAPHWTQFDGVTLHRRHAVAVAAARPRRPARGTCATHSSRELARHLGLHADVARLVVARAVAREEHRRELVERELAVGHRVRRRAVGRKSSCVGVALGRPVARREPARPSPSRSPTERDAAPEPTRRSDWPHVAHVHAGRARRTTSRSARRTSSRAPPADGATRPRPRAAPTRPRSGSP